MVKAEPTALLPRPPYLVSISSLPCLPPWRPPSSPPSTVCIRAPHGLAPPARPCSQGTPSLAPSPPSCPLSFCFTRHLFRACAQFPQPTAWLGAPGEAAVWPPAVVGLRGAAEPWDPAPSCSGASGMHGSIAATPGVN